MQSGGSSQNTLKKENGAAFTTPVWPALEPARTSVTLRAYAAAVKPAHECLPMALSEHRALGRSFSLREGSGCQLADRSRTCWLSCRSSKNCQSKRLAPPDFPIPSSFLQRQGFVAEALAGEQFARHDQASVLPRISQAGVPPRVDRVNDRLLNADGRRPSNLREPRIPSIPVPGDDKIHNLLFSRRQRSG